MIRHSFIIGLAVAVLSGAGIRSSWAQEEAVEAPAPGNSMVAASEAAIADAEAEVEKARAAIERGKGIIATIPEDSPLMPDVALIIQAASENWQIAISSLEGAKQSASKIATASSDSVANDYALLSKVNAGVAHSGAKVVQIALVYVEAIAQNKAESLELIRTTLQDALASCSQVQFNYERVKTLIAQKYSK